MGQWLLLLTLLVLVVIAALFMMAAGRAGNRRRAVAVGLTALAAVVLVYAGYREYTQRDLFRVLASDGATVECLADGRVIEVPTETLMAGVTGAIIYDRLQSAAGGVNRYRISFHTDGRTIQTLDIVTVPQQQAEPAHVYRRLHDQFAVARMRGRFYQFNHAFYHNLEAILGSQADGQ